MHDEVFNLLDKDWIPVLYENGRFARVGVLRAFTDSGRIRQIAASNPMDRVALLRFLLAVLLWCRPNISDADPASLNSANGIPVDWLKKLQDNRAAFNLLGDGKRFYQDEGIRDNDSRPVADLLAEFPGANSLNHMRHVIHDGSYGFCPACCTLGILRLSVWAPANSFYPASVNPASAAYAFEEKKNLLLTLVANLPKEDASTVPPPWLSTRPPDAPDAISYLAWRPRKLWLNVADSGQCANCGRSGILVKHLAIAKGWPTPTTSGQQFGKDVLIEFQKLHVDYKAKNTDRRKWANKVVKSASLIHKCRMGLIAQADSITEQAPRGESDAAKVARICDQLYTAGNIEARKELTKKPTREEQSNLNPEDSQVKKFWVDDPHLLKETEAIGLPALIKDVAEHACKFWRDAVRVRNKRPVKAVAIGPIVKEFVFHDARSLELPDPVTQDQAKLPPDCSQMLGNLLKRVTPNPGREHPEVKAALVLLTPEAETRIRATLDTANDADFLREIYQPLTEQVIASTTAGSPLRRRTAAQAAHDLLRKAIHELTETDDPSSAPAGNSEAAPKKPKRQGQKKKEGS